jgi:branched-chain amino acid transport system ATP-binding protein
MPILELSGITKRFGDVTAVRDVALAVEAGERRAILGPNGAGKSTLFDLIGGQRTPSAGSITLNGRPVAGKPPHVMWAHGVSRTFQRNQVFPTLSVRENVRLAAMRQHIGRLFRLSSSPHDLDVAVADVLARVNLAGRATQRAGELAYGEQRQLEVALALVGKPCLLLLDEPTAGMSPAETAAVMRILADLPRSITLMIVEHDMDVVFALCDRITVMHMGEVLTDGTPAEIAANEDVRRVYMGTEA